MVTFTRKRLFFVFVFLWTAAIALAGLGSEATSALTRLAGGTPTATATPTLTPTATGSPTCSPTGTPYILYNQNDNPAPTPGGIISQTAAFGFESLAADDFVVPAGQTWFISEVVVVGEYDMGGSPATGFNVRFHRDMGTLPEFNVLQSRNNCPYGEAAGTFTIKLLSPVMLSPGTYWVSVQSRPPASTPAQWFWDNRAVVSNSGAAWENPGGGYGTGCNTWGRKTTCVPTTNGPDQLFELIGTAGGVCGTPTPTPTYTQTPSPLPSCTPATWITGPDLNPPMGAARSVGVYFQGTFGFYAIGGQSSDEPGSNFVHPFEYVSGRGWATKAAAFPDTDVSDMACGALTVSGSRKIYCVGGRASGAATATARVFSYDPTTDVVASLAGSDDWPGDPPASGNILPGGFAVLNNKLYTIGAFQISPPTVLGAVWEFDPSRPEGSRWTAKAPLPVAHGFVPATAIAGYIYTAGGSVVSGTTLEDSSDAYKYDPVADHWTTIASVPRPVGETRAINFNGKMWVLGGGRTDPNPSNVVNKYSPDTNTWTIAPSFALGRRNFPADTNGFQIFLAGGYDAANTIRESMQIIGLCEFLATPTATSTPTATATASPVCTPFFTENFDGVAAPALPAGWTATNIVPGPSPAPVMWATTTAGSDSGPNNAFVDDTNTISDKRLDSVPIAIGPGPVELTFRNNFNTEANRGIFWDGGVLEISSPNINGGTFTDVLDPAVGGSFVTGGYTGVINSNAHNPLAGRPAWSGNSGGYIFTIVNLGPNVAGQTIVLRFRMGTDVAFSAPGWHIDNITIGTCTAPLPTATATPIVITHLKPRADFDGDGKTDLSVFRPSEGVWYFNNSTNGLNARQFGVSTDIPVPADYDGDGITDIAVYRPGGYWYRIDSDTGLAQLFDVNGAVPPYIPQPGKFNAMVPDEAGAFNTDTGNWYFNSSTPGTVVRHWGQSGDKPCREDYNGDGVVDLCVFRHGIWYIANLDLSGQRGETFGTTGDIAVPADYDRDGRADLAVFRPSNGNWYFHFSRTNSFGAVHWGQSGDIPVPGDYDGDGRYDIAVYRDGIWYINASADGPTAIQFGLSSDIPIPKMYIP